MKQEVKSAIVTVICVGLIIAVVYLSTAYFLTGEIGNKSKVTKKTTESYSGLSLNYENMIIAGKVFDMKESSYMVIFFSQDKINDELKSTLSSYDSLEKETKLYKVNIDEAINKYVKSDEQNDSATNSSELKINKTTLITIKNGKITSYITDNDTIINTLK